MERDAVESFGLKDGSMEHNCPLYWKDTPIPPQKSGMKKQSKLKF
jgi:hypothetical protein